MYGVNFRGQGLICCCMDYRRCRVTDTDYHFVGWREKNTRGTRQQTAGNSSQHFILEPSAPETE